MSDIGKKGTVGLSHHELSGPWRIDGTLSELSVPGVYEFVCVDKTTMQAFRRGWSNADGTYAIRKIAQHAWVVLLFDSGISPKNAKASDQLTYTVDTATD